jgi:hypothetical protein
VRIYRVSFHVSGHFSVRNLRVGFRLVGFCLRTVYMNFFDQKDVGNHPLKLCPKVVKHPVYIRVNICVYISGLHSLGVTFPPHDARSNPAEVVEFLRTEKFGEQVFREGL